jgi:fused signal recognition particle receptor
MFDKLRSAFSDAAKSLSEKELNEKDIEDILFELEISLHESDVASVVIDEIKSDLKTRLIGTKVEKNEIEKFVKDSLISTISSLFDTVGKVDIFELIDEKKKSGQPFLILFVGINGTGKTTSLAKMAYMLQQKKYSVVVAAADTFRAGAIEQLREHTNRLNLKLVAQNYNSDPAAVARDAVLYAKSHKVDCVLIDTAGRMQTNKNLMEQISKITKVVNPDFKIFVGDSLAGNDTVNQAKEFFEHVKFDGTILTKSDADARGGAALSVVKVTSTPVLYLGIGQEYPDLKSFDKETFLETVFGSLENVELKKPESTPELVPTPEPIPESIPEPKSEPEPDLPPALEPEPETISDDPFAGISDEDISKYSELFNVTPPENDKEAKQLSKKIKGWINQGRPNAVDNIKEIHEDELKDPQTFENEEQKPDKEETKPKKKRGRFGLFRK